MNGRPERAQTRPPRPTRAISREHVTCVAADHNDRHHHRLRRGIDHARDESGTAPIGPCDPPIVSVPDAPSPGSAGPSAKATSSAPRATSVALLRLVAHRNDAAAARLPVRRRAGRPRGLRRLAAHDRRYDQPTAEGLRAAGPRAGFPGGSVRRRHHSAHRDRDLKALVKAARKAGVRLAVESAYRSEAQQHRTFAGWVRTSGEAEARRFSARAGHSEHQLGTAIDFKAAGGGSPWTPAFARSRHARWLAANAWRFGWIQSYPPGAETQTCYGAEAWHYRYVGRDVAAEVHASGMTLRAWLWLHPSAD